MKADKIRNQTDVELELQLEELIVEIALLVQKLLVGQVTDFLRFHKSVPVLTLSVPPIRVSRTWSARAACAKPDASPQKHPAA